MSTAGLFQRLRSLVPLPPVLVGTVLAHHDDDTSTVLIPGSGQVSYGGGIAVGSLIRPRGRTVPVGKKAFVRAGVIETQAPDVEPFPIVIGEVIVPPTTISRTFSLVAPQHCGTSPKVTLTGFDPSTTYTLTILAGAWSAWPSDDAFGAPVNRWITAFSALDENDNATLVNGGAGATPEAAFAVAASGSVTGGSTYGFFLPDPVPADNVGSLQIRIEG